ncbi:hypothetical protein PENSUB_9296 [Penicillium subrubescens]|uniref:Uncharacterized protein n=1 Tax=Penicillium subrubescens TaxID=1316194 RepID=A0A1Q5TD93_9EURO|nr:hypothetical protein PENSUB_9296 [Penicillium subrubescens]
MPNIASDSACYEARVFELAEDIVQGRMGGTPFRYLIASMKFSPRGNRAMSYGCASSQLSRAH